MSNQVNGAIHELVLRLQAAELNAASEGPR